MVLQATSRRSAALIGALALAGVSCVVVALTHQENASTVPLATPAHSVGSPGPDVVRGQPVAAHGHVVPLPVSISVPAIGVESTLLTLGQAADGSLAAPAPGPHYDQAGWYHYSPRPGDLGPAVIVGHIDSKSGGPSVFFRLGDLRSHDVIDVERADGTVAVFSVDDVRRFHKADFPTQLVYGNTDHAALRLITCGGTFDRSTGHYLDNVVVTASLVRAG